MEDNYILSQTYLTLRKLLNAFDSHDPREMTAALNRAKSTYEKLHLHLQSKRGTGRTTEQLRNACRECRLGRNIIYVCPSLAAAKYIADNFGLPFSQSPMVSDTGNGGSITFVSITQDPTITLAGRERETRIVFDHSVFEIVEDNRFIDEWLYRAHQLGVEAA